MKNDLVLLTHEVEKKIGKKIHVGSDFEKLASIFSVKHHLKVSAQGLHKVWGYVSGKEKPTHETLNKLALFVGYQSWDDFHEALHGEDDGNLSYDTDEDHELKPDSSDDIDWRKIVLWKNKKGDSANDLQGISFLFLLG